MEKRCPYCGGAMEEGFLQSSHTISFVKKVRWFMIDGSKGDFRLPFSHVTGGHFPASYCKACEKIVIALENEED